MSPSDAVLWLLGVYLALVLAVVEALLLALALHMLRERRYQRGQA